MLDPNFFQMQKAKAANMLFGDPMPGVEAAPGIVPHDGPGSPYGGSNLQAPSDRYTDAARRGGAPLTIGNLGRTFGNMMGITGSSAVTTGFTSMAEKLAGLSPGTLGGFANMEGHFKIDHKPGQKMTFSVLHDNMRKGAAASKRERAESYAASRAGAGGSSRGRLGGGLGDRGGSRGGSQGGQSGGPRGY